MVSKWSIVWPVFVMMSSAMDKAQTTANSPASEVNWDLEGLMSKISDLSSNLTKRGGGEQFQPNSPETHQDRGIGLFVLGTIHKVRM